MHTEELERVIEATTKSILKISSSNCSQSFEKYLIAMIESDLRRREDAVKRLEDMYEEKYDSRADKY